MSKRKTKTITVSPTFNVTVYVIERVTDSVEYTPGDEISKKVLESLCLASDWKVTVGPMSAKTEAQL